MAKFNLKNILVKDYEVSLVEAINFEQWVGKNMDYEAVMEKNFRDVSFKSSKTNKKDFLKDLKERALKLDPTKSIKDVLDLIAADKDTKSDVLYEKIRKLELELKETKNINDAQYKMILDLKAEKKDKYVTELKHLLNKFDLKIGDENISPTTEGVRNKFLENLTFLNNNRAFIHACIKLKNAKLVENIETVLKEKENEYEYPEKIKSLNNETEGYYIILTKMLIDLKKVFVTKITKDEVIYSSFYVSCKKIFGTSSLGKIFTQIGVAWATEENVRGSRVYTTDEPIKKIVEKYNEKALYILNNKQMK